MEQRIQTLDDLRELINHTICEHEELEPGAHPMTERTLEQAGKPCGRYFCLHGPRATKFSAIWASDKRAVLFYDSSGVRFLQLSVGDVDQLDAAAA
jgi:hypothetical protein